MRFFLVFQGTTYQEEKKLSCLWAPKFGKSGQEVHHHKRLVEVKINDRIIHLVNRKIVSINKSKFFCTEDHPLKTKDGWKAVNAKMCIQNYPDLNIVNEDLAFGDEIETADGSIVVNEIAANDNIGGLLNCHPPAVLIGLKFSSIKNLVSLSCPHQPANLCTFLFIIFL